MGLGKTVVEDYDHIWSEDGALDVECKNEDGEPDFAHRFGLYMADGDESHLPLKQGKTPVRWVLRHLRRRIVRRILDSYSGKGQEALYDAAAAALVAVKGLKTEDGKDARIDKVRGDDGYERVSDDDMDYLDEHFPGLVSEIGSLAIRKAMPDPK